MIESQSTTRRLGEQLERHADTLDRAVKRYGVPVHVLFVEEMGRNATGYSEVVRAQYPNTVVAFAAKSNPCRGALRAAHTFGLGADVASEYELRAALEESIEPGRIVCNGNAKSDAYLRNAVGAGALIAVDNEDELDLLEAIAAETGRTPRILIRFRGMPLSGLTSEDQTTASEWTKFGFHIDESTGLFARLRGQTTFEFQGVSAHVGTQIADPLGYDRLLEHLLDLSENAVRLGLPVSALDIGGGFPVRFLSEDAWNTFTKRLLARVRGRTDLAHAVTWNDLPLGFAHGNASTTAEPEWIGKAYWTPCPGAMMLDHLLEHRHADGRTTVDRLRDLGTPTLILEPGRSLMATAGVTLTRVAGVKHVLGHHVVSLELGINNHGTNLISPDIFPAAVLPERGGDTEAEAFLAGRLCFSGDMISKAKVPLNRLPTRGERFVLFHTGAYSADHFASHSCGFPRPAKVAVREDGAIEVWRRPDRFEDVFGSVDQALLVEEASREEAD